MTETERVARIERLREMIKLQRRANAYDSRVPYYTVDALELIVDLLEHSR